MYQIVPMTEDHLEQVEEIERLCFGDPWSRKIFEQSLAEEKTTALVARREDVKSWGISFSQRFWTRGAWTISLFCRRRGGRASPPRCWGPFDAAGRSAD